ncbi:DUF3152 domain-containing protein [Candidatus Neomicrothrix sp.]|uniref:DUF3152 domain-containing protein n=1 Tax=Candidatus Neomicrothrix sp. TaxID=2719034 RepID=UPI0004B8A57C|nr:DUF3152 domain-containing protein [Candidatus Microthrix sp.]MBP7594498.1 DUF3152 domain-containing protein [Candidatus Microthrix sp.]MBP7877524.1 DUF3152 domain-containing protein [Candidatus Microthrix sp.]NLH66447.1 DUF3152 domain-containing protein [Candidatus Microthrix parvicella]
MALHFEARVGDLSDEAFAEQALATLNDPRGWGQAGFTFRSDPSSKYRVVLAEPAEVDELCLPLVTGGRVSCQNDNVVAINANRWRNATDDWDKSKDAYRQYVVNHEVGHLIGQFHPANRCPRPGEPEAVMAQQTKGLEGCQGNPWPLDWEVVGAAKRPVGYAPTPDVEPAVRAVNPGGGVPGAAPTATTRPAAPTTAGATPATETLPASEDPLPAAGVPEAVDSDEAATTLPEPTAAERQLDDAPLSGRAQSVSSTGNDDSNLPVVVVLSFLAVTLISLGIALLMRWRSRGRDVVYPGDEVDDHSTVAAVNPEHTEGWESEPIEDLFGWAVNLEGGAGLQGAITWVAPSRWTPAQTFEFLEAVEQLNPQYVEPASVAASVSTVLKANKALRPIEGEGLGLVIVGSTQLVAAVVGAAEVAELRGGRMITTRRQGVVRLRGSGDGPLELTLRQTGNDWPAGAVLIREPPIDQRATPPEIRAADVSSQPEH